MNYIVTKTLLMFEEITHFFLSEEYPFRCIVIVLLLLQIIIVVVLWKIARQK